jgi:hypothetical protein
MRWQQIDAGMFGSMAGGHSINERPSAEAVFTPELGISLVPVLRQMNSWDTVSVNKSCTCE